MLRASSRGGGTLRKVLNPAVQPSHEGRPKNHAWSLSEPDGSGQPSKKALLHPSPDLYRLALVPPALIQSPAHIRERGVGRILCRSFLIFCIKKNCLTQPFSGVRGEKEGADARSCRGSSYIARLSPQAPPHHPTLQGLVCTATRPASRERPRGRRPHPHERVGGGAPIGRGTGSTAGSENGPRRSRKKNATSMNFGRCVRIYWLGAGPPGGAATGTFGRAS